MLRKPLFHKTIKFSKFMPIAIAISLVLIMSGFVGYVIKGGFKKSVDFSGGVRIEVKVNVPYQVNLEEVRKLLSSQGLGQNVMYIGNPKENSLFIGLPTASEQILEQKKEEVIRVLNERYGQGNIEVRKIEFIGPKLGKEFFDNALKLSFLVVFLILIYVGFRFDFAFGVGAVVALLHDLLMMLASAIWFDIEIDISIIAAILTILGYSVNDTIVVFDRIRENRSINPHMDLVEITDISLTQVLNRTALTSLTTLFPILAIYFFGGHSLKNFSFLLTIGIISGTYSSIFIASPIAVWLHKGRVEKKEKTAKTTS